MLLGSNHDQLRLVLEGVENRLARLVRLNTSLDKNHYLTARL